MEWEPVSHSNNIGIEQMPAPTAGIFDSPSVCVRANTEWVSFIIARLELLSSPNIWLGNESTQLFAAQQIEEFLNSFQSSECPDCPEPECVTCKTIYTDNPAIEWNPANPFTHPYVVPEPYENPPFVRGERPLLAGSQEGDVTSWYGDLVGSTNPLDLAEWALTEFYPWALTHPLQIPSIPPRFKFRFSGKGKVYLTLLAVPEGGLAYITLDGNPIPVVAPFAMTSISIDEITSWSSALSTLGLPVLSYFTNKLIAERLVVVEVPTDGEHYIDVTFMPRLTFVDVLGVPSIPYFGWGGGLRKIEMCGESIEIECPEPPPPTPPELRISADGSCIEWLNPATEQWECQLQLPTTSGAAADGGCYDECDDCDCEDDESEDCEEC